MLLKFYIRTKKSWNKSQSTQLLVQYFKLEDVSLGCAVSTNTFGYFDVQGYSLTWIWVSSKCSFQAKRFHIQLSIWPIFDGSQEWWLQKDLYDRNSQRYSNLPWMKISFTAMTGGAGSLYRCIKDLMVWKLHHCGVLMCWLMRNLCWSLKLSESLTGKAANRELERQSERNMPALLFMVMKALIHQQDCANTALHSVTSTQTALKTGSLCTQSFL